MMKIYGIDHIQVAIPYGSEQQARAFYAGILGLDVIQKPATLAGTRRSFVDDPFGNRIELMQRKQGE